jgi:hypothetical protein
MCSAVSTANLNKTNEKSIFFVQINFKKIISLMEYSWHIYSHGMEQNTGIPHYQNTPSQQPNRRLTEINQQLCVQMFN